MVSLDISNTSKVIAIVGAYVVFVGLVSYFLKNRLYLSEALLAAVLGIVTGPRVLGWFNPLDWVGGEQETLNDLTFEITRIVIGIQVLFCGIALPKAYLRKEWKSLLILLGPVMVCAWFVCALLIWGLIPGMTFLECLVIAACVTPTDPVLANSICQGRFAEKNVPQHVRNIIIAESGANDGLGFPFLYLALYQILRHVPENPTHTIGGAVAEWVYNVLLYQITLSIVIGAVIGYAARKALKYCEQRDLVDHDNFLAFGVGLTFFTLGVVGMVGSDDILCCFIAGNSFTWDDWFRVRSSEHSFQDVVDTLLNSTIFLYIGSIIPWNEFGNWYNITPWRLVVLGICVMLLRRVPWVVGLHKWIPTLPTVRESAFAGFFGPIGVGAVFYVQVALRELSHTTPEREQLRQTITPIVYFLVLTSVVVHGITIPIGKGFSGVRRTLTLTRSTQANGVDPVGGLPKAPTSLPIGPAERYPHGLFEVRRDDGEMEMMDEHDFNEAKERGEELFISTSTSVSEVGREGEGGSPLKLNTTTGTGTGTKILTGIDHSHGDSGKIISANGNGSKKPETAIRFEEPKISNSSTFDGNHTYAINHGSTTAAELSSTLESDSNSNSYLSPGKKRGPIPNSILAKSVGMDADVTPVPSRSGSPTPRDGF